MYNFILRDHGLEVRGDSADMQFLQEQEVCIFHVYLMHHFEIFTDVIQRAISLSRKVVISVPVTIASHQAFKQHIDRFPGLYAISVRFPISSPSDEKFGGALSGPDGDSALVRQYDFLREGLSFKESAPVHLIPEIEITDHLELLGPTLMALSQRQPPWMVLAVNSEPTPKRVSALRDCFEYLQIRGFPLIDIHFSFENEWARNWKAQTECFFSGPEEVHIDLSNKCTHSCVFCALYAPEIIAEFKATNRMDDNLKKFMSAQLDEQKALELIQSLPITTKLVQFGGAGDPMLHPKAIELITHARQRAIPVEILSNMEYFKEGDHEKLTALSGRLDMSLKFIANISAATPETYVLTRPRQTHATFNKVIGNLRKFSELRKKNHGRGVHFSIMCVINRLNFHEASKFVELAKDVGAAQLWFKPLELHSVKHHSLLPKPEEKPLYVKALREALQLADKMGVTIYDRGFIEETIEQFSRPN